MYPFNDGDTFSMYFTLSGRTRHFIIEKGKCIDKNARHMGYWSSPREKPDKISNYVKHKQIYLGGE